MHFKMPSSFRLPRACPIGFFFYAPSVLGPSEPATKYALHGWTADGAPQFVRLVKDDATGRDVPASDDVEWSVRLEQIASIVYEIHVQLVPQIVDKMFDAAIASAIKDKPMMPKAATKLMERAVVEAARATVERQAERN